MCVMQPMSRTPITGAMTINASPSGADLQDCWNNLSDNYEFTSRGIVTIQAAGGVYRRGLGAQGLVSGQQSPDQIVVLGNPAAANGCVIQPDGSGFTDCVVAAFGAMLTVSGFTGDLSLCTPGQGIITVAQNSTLVLGRPGDACAFVFANHNLAAGNQYNDVTVNAGGELDICTGTLIFGAATNAQKQCMFDIAQNGRLLFGTNGGQAPLLLKATGAPNYIAGIFRLDTGSNAVLGATYQGAVHGQQWWVDGFSSLITYSPYGIMFGDQAGYTGEFGQVRQQ